MLNPFSVPTRFPPCVRLAEVTAPPVSVATSIDPPVWLIAPAETRSSVSPAALIALLSVMPPASVVSATVWPAPVSLSVPFTTSA